MSGPHKRLRAWLAWKGLTVTDGSEQLRCSRTLLSLIANGHRRPGRRVANMIERITAPWPKGPIRASEWDSGS